MFKGIELKLHPNRTQQEQLDLMFGNGHGRFIWNQISKNGKRPKSKKLSTKQK